MSKSIDIHNILREANQILKRAPLPNPAKINKTFEKIEKGMHVQNSSSFQINEKSDTLNTQALKELKEEIVKEFIAQQEALDYIYKKAN